MTWEIVFVIVLLAVAIVSFLAEKIPTDQTAITAFVAILVAGSLPIAERLPSVTEMLTVFSNPAPMTIAAMFILSAALEKVGLIATCVAASASFSTPIGYQTNTYVYGIGGYRFSDFARAGLPLNLMYFIVSVLLIPRIWSF